MKSTSLCFNISSVWKFVIKKEISYPYTTISARPANQTNIPRKGLTPRTVSRMTDLDRFPSQDKEGFCSLRQESSKLVDEYLLNVVGLLDLDAYPDAVDTRLDQDSLVLVARNG
jgi:hypothetical protein